MAYILKKNIYLVIAIALLILGCIAYWPIFRGYFLSDDLIHVGYLREVSNNFNLLLKNFYSNWLDVPTTSFYRPFISVSLFFDHLFWGYNPTGFHVTNLLLHVGSSLLIFLILFRLIEVMRMLLSLLGSLVFLLYPINVEAVYWIIGRVDTQASFFYLLSFYLYIVYRENKNKIPLILSMLSALIGLGSKEIVVTLPIVIIMYEIYVLLSSSAISFLGMIKKVITQTWSYIAILIGYFLLRRFALGTLLGGYNDQKVSVSLTKELFEKWKYPIQKLFFPWNTEYFSTFSIMKLLHFTYSAFWIIFLILIILGMKHVLNIRNLYLIGCFLLVLIPVSPVIFVGQDLQGSRTLYLPCAFFVILLISIASDITKVKKLNTLINYVLIGSLLVLSIVHIYTLSKNLEPWDYVSQRISKLPASFEKIRDERPDEEEKTIILNMVDNYYGAYFLRNGYTNLLSPPILKGNFNNINIYSNKSAEGFGSDLKKEILNNSKKISVYNYDLSSNKLNRFNVTHPISNASNDDIVYKGSDIVNWNKSKDIVLVNVNKGVSSFNVTGKDPFVFNDKVSINTNNIESVQITMRVSKGDSSLAQLYWATSKSNNFSEDKKIDFPIISDGQFHTYHFSAHDFSDWNGSDTITKFRIDPIADSNNGKVDIMNLTFTKIKLNEENLPKWNDLSGWYTLAMNGGFQKNDKATVFNGTDLSFRSPVMLLDPWKSNVISLTMTVHQSKSDMGKIYWISDQDRNYDESKKVEFPIIADGLPHTYNISVKNEIAWWSKGPIVQLRIDPVVGDSSIEIKNIEIGSGDHLFPTLEIFNDNQNDSDFYKLNFALNFKRQSINDKNLALHVDATNVDGAKSILFEISHLPFENPNGFSFTKQSVFTYKDNLTVSEKYELDLSRFPINRGLYYIRMIAIDAQGEPVGNFSNPCVVLFE